MEGGAPSKPLEACGRCGCPLVGNEVYCSACGRRLMPPDRRRRIGLATLGLALLGALAASRTCGPKDRPAPRSSGAAEAPPVMSRP